MKVAVITPYYKESKKVILRNIKSVLGQTHNDVFHVLVSDGYPQDWINDISTHHIALPNVGNFGDTPRAIGAAYAAGVGADAIIFLDADCWIPSYHVSNMVEVAKQSVGIVTCPRTVWLDGEEMGVCSESNGLHFNDTNCYLITKPYFGVCGAWAFKNQKDAIVGDRVFWNAVQRSGAVIVRVWNGMVNYDSDFAHHYQMFGRTPPPNSKVLIGGEVKKWSETC